MDNDPGTNDSPSRDGIGFAVASLVLGLLAVLSSVLLIGALLGGVAILLGLIHLAQRRRGIGTAWAGILLALLGIALSGGFGFLYVKSVQWARAGWDEVVSEMESVNVEQATAAFTEWTGETAPDFTVTSLEGEEFTLSELRGRRVVLAFWATWCPPCRREVPDFNQLAATHAPDDIVILAISEEDANVLKEFVEEEGVTYPVVSNAHLPRPFGDVIVVPTTFIINRDGIIERTLEGYLGYEKLEQVATGDDQP